MSSRKRIAIYYNIGFGGGRRWLYEVATRLDRYHDLDFYCIHRSSQGTRYPDGTDLAQRTKITSITDTPRVPGKLGQLANVPASYRDFIRFDRTARTVAREIDAKNYDLLFASVGDYCYAPLILRHARTPSAYYCHEPMRTAYEPDVPRDYMRPLPVIGPSWRWFNSGYAGLRKAWDAQAARAAGLVVVNSRYTQDYATRAYGISSVVNHPGVDTEAFRPGDERREPFVLSGPGALIRSKGYDWAIHAIGAIPAPARPKLVIAGNDQDARERAYLESVAGEAGVEVDIRIGVADTELKRLLRTASLMLYTPHLEPFGLAAIEAMASGTPVVAVREAGPTETVIDGVTGLLRERDAQQLGEAVAALLDDGDLRGRMGRAAREDAVQRWTWDKAVEQLQELLADAAESERTSSRSGGSRARDRVETTELTTAR